MVNDMDGCQQVRDMLADYRTGMLTARKSAWLEWHIQQCAGCANELGALDEVLALVEANAAEYEPPAGLWNSVYNRITSPESRRSTLFGGFRRWMAKPVRAAGAGLAVAALAIGIIVSIGPRQANAPAQVASNVEYVQGHALYAGQAPLADRVYLTVVAASSESGK